MKLNLPLLAVLVATQTGCSLLSGNTVSVPIASNNGNNNGSQNGSYNSAVASAPQPVDIGVARLPTAGPNTIPTGNATPVVLPASLSLNRVSTELANLPHTDSGAIDLQSIYYGGRVNQAVEMSPAQSAGKTAAVAGEAGPEYTGTTGSR